MAKPEGLWGGFELANGRAADRVSEKEAEAGRRGRQSPTASAAASPWHDPGRRLQRLHKEAFLGAAVSLLVRGRPGRRDPGRHARPRREVAALPAPAPLVVPARASPPPVTGGRRLPPLPAGGAPRSSAALRPARPPLHGQQPVPSCALVGGRPRGPGRSRPSTSCPRRGRPDRRRLPAAGPGPALRALLGPRRVSGPPLTPPSVELPRPLQAHLSPPRLSSSNPIGSLHCLSCRERPFS